MFATRGALQAGLAVLMVLGLGACAQGPRQATYQSAVLKKPAEPIRQLDFIFIQEEIRAANAPPYELRSPKLAAHGYYDIPKLMEQRVPVVLAANGLSGSLRLLSKAAAEDAAAYKPQAVGTPFIVWRIKGGQVTQLNWMESMLALSHSVKLMSLPAAGPPELLWVADIKLQLGTAGVAQPTGLHRPADAAVIDSVIVGLLDEMARSGVLMLSHGPARAPPDEKRL